MLRAIAAVVGGYAVMFVFVFLTFSGLFLAIGADGAFRPGSWDVSILWIAVSSALNVVAALAGGYVCALIARGGRAPLALACLVLVLGLVTAAMVLNAPPLTEPRTGDVPNLEAMTKARTPLWVALLNPVIGVAGTLAGARLRKSQA